MPPGRLPRRAGLAPLELVGALPLMLFVMALMIVFGTAAAWKVRAHAVARQAQWRALAGRSGANDPKPYGWPPSATMLSQPSSPAVLAGDPFAQFAVVRGPMLADPQTGRTLGVNTRRLDMRGGLTEGVARLVRAWPLFGSLPPGRFTYVVRHVLLDGTRWQYWMTGVSGNLGRRSPTLYQLNLAALAPDETQRYARAAAAILTNPHVADLKPIDGGDPDIRQLLGITTPDEHPRIGVGSEPSTIAALGGSRLVPNYCPSDPLVVLRDKVLPLIRQIDRLPRTLSQHYIGYYQQKINQLKKQMPPPAVEIADLQAKIDELKQFIGTLGP